MPWWERRMCGFDLETTGTDPLEARICSAAIVHVGAGQEVRKHRWIVNPGIPIPSEAAAVHGITTAVAQLEGIEPTMAIAGIVNRIEEAWDSAEPVVIFNAPYDLTVVACELRRHGLTKEVALGPVIDPLVLDRHLDRYRKGSRKLVAICDHWRAKHDGPHDSCSDAIAAARVAYAMGKANVVVKCPGSTRERPWCDGLHVPIGSIDVDDLHDLQVEWYRAQQEHMEAYFKSQGKTGDFNTGWPVRTAVIGKQQALPLNGGST